MPTLSKRLTHFADHCAEKLEQKFESRFAVVARDPRVLAILGSSLNFVAAIRIESQKFETEAASLRSRLGQNLATFRPFSTRSTEVDT